MSAVPQADWLDLGAPDFVADPYPAYERLRAQGGAAWHAASGQWLVARHREVGALLRDRRLGRVAPQPPTVEPAMAPFWRLQWAGLLDMEAPDHPRVRRLVARAFTPGRVAALRPAVGAIADRLAAEFLAAGGGDLVGALAEPLPVAVIGALLGVPDEDLGLLRPWSADICAMFELDPAPDAATRAVRASEEFSAYLRALAAARRADPRDDLISALTQVVDAGERLTEDELVGTCVLLLNAGHEATVNVVANGWLALLAHPEQLAWLRADPARVPGAVEELMRYDSPLQLFSRWVYEDVTVDGVRIPRGDRVALLFGSANRDPAAFDRPERLDLARADNPHISFGAGIHYCLGAPLARLELAESFAALLRHAAVLEPAGEPVRRPGFVIRGLTSLPLTAR